jgi:hypothetical protein
MAQFKGPAEKLPCPKVGLGIENDFYGWKRISQRNVPKDVPLAQFLYALFVVCAVGWALFPSQWLFGIAMNDQWLCSWNRGRALIGRGKLSPHFSLHPRYLSLVKPPVVRIWQMDRF